MKRPVKTEQITNLLRDRFLSGYYPGKSRLPDERSLVAELNVSRNTIRAALSALEQEHLITRYSRLGTFLNVGNPSTDNFCYYILPCHTFCDTRQNWHIYNAIHLLLMQHLINECNIRNLQYSMLPLSNDNTPEHLLAERLWNLPQNSKLLLTGAHWYRSISRLFIDKGFRIAMLHSSSKEVVENNSNFCFINTDWNVFLQKGFEFLKQKGCRRILFCTDKKFTNLPDNGCAVFQVSRPESALFDSKYDLKKIKTVFQKNKCDAVFLFNFNYVKEYRSINALFGIPEHIPVLINEFLFDVSVMAHPPFVIGLNHAKVIRTGLDFLFSDAPCGQIAVDDIIIYDKKHQPIVTT